MKTTKQVGPKPGRKAKEPQSKSKPSTGAVTPGEQPWSISEQFKAAKRERSPHAAVRMILKNLRGDILSRKLQLEGCLDLLLKDVPDDDRLKLDVACMLHLLELHGEKLLKVDKGAESIKRDALANAAGFTVNLQGPDGKTFAEVEFLPPMSEQLKQLAESRGVSLGALIHELVLSLLDSAESEPGQGGAAAAAVPDRAALELLAVRVGCEAESEKFLKAPIALTLPGLAFGEWKIDELLWRLTAGIYFRRATALIEELILSRVSAWEAVELAEVLSIAEEIQEGNVGRARDESVGLSLNEWYGCSSHRRVKDPNLLVHCAFVLFQHAGVISREVLPRMSELPEAAHLAETLVIAEAVVNTVEKRAVGTVAQPTALQQQAVELIARCWREWPKNQSFSQDIPGKPGALAALVGKPTVAA